MRLSALSILCLAAAVACGGGGALPIDDSGTTASQPPAPEGPRIDGVVPSRVSVEAGAQGTVYGARFCMEALLELDGKLVALDTKTDQALSFHFPAAADRTGVTTTSVTVRCPKGDATLDAAVVRDPALVVQPDVLSYGPGGNVSDLQPAVRIAFNRPMDASTLAQNVGIEGVTGTVTWDAGANAATFTPAAPLDNGRTWVGFVRGGADGVRSSFGDPLREDTRWIFRTCMECGGPLP